VKDSSRSSEENNRIKVIANDQGNRNTPSCVAFTDNERLVGDATKNQINTNSTNTVFGMSSSNPHPLLFLFLSLSLSSSFRQLK
jgi:molecular chaperone DnaK (HSP70)